MLSGGTLSISISVRNAGTNVFTYFPIASDQCLDLFLSLYLMHVSLGPWILKPASLPFVSLLLEV